jgi:hypothetical protein
MFRQFNQQQRFDADAQGARVDLGMHTADRTSVPQSLDAFVRR